MGIKNKIKNLMNYRFLLYQLVKRDFKIKYRGSVLGVLWSVLNPLLTMIVLSVVFSQVFRAVDNYKMYLLSGLTIFNFFSEATNMACTSVVYSFGLITKVHFPKFIIPTSKVITSTINLGITTVVYLILGSFMGLKFSWLCLLIPFVLIMAIIFSLGIGYILAALYVFFRDTMHFYGIIIMIWMYSTPILYPIESLPEQIIPIFRLNPLNQFIVFFRDITLYAQVPTLENVLLCLGWSIGAFILGIYFFVKKQNKFIYYA